MKTRPTEADGMKRRPKRLAASRDRDAASRTVTGIEALKGQVPLIVLGDSLRHPGKPPLDWCWKETTDKGGQLMDVASLADLPQETAEHHDHDEKTAPKHGWWDWYAPYIKRTRAGEHPGGGIQSCRALHGGSPRRSSPNDFAPMTVLSERLRRWVDRWVLRL
jgi:hypothetical protein